MVELKLQDFHRLDITKIVKSGYRAGISLDAVIDFQKVFLMSSDENYILSERSPWIKFWKLVRKIKFEKLYEKL